MTAHKHAQLMLAYAQDAAETDKPWERWEATWGHKATWNQLGSSPEWRPEVDYRRKPKTIRIGAFDVPEPLREAPKYNTRVFGVMIDRSCGEVYEFPWNDGDVQGCWLARGLVHSTEEAAELHAKALLSFTQKAST